MTKEQQPDKWSHDSEKLFEGIKATLAARAIGAQADLTNLGQIDSMELPSGWVSGKPHVSGEAPEHAATYQEFHPPGDDDCQLGFYYRGRRVSKLAGETFHKILKQPEHVLTHAEFDLLAEIIGDKINPADFHTASPRTKLIDGKMVLVVDGRYKELDHDNSHMYVDSDGTGTAIQEIFFQAPVKKFAKYEQAAHKAMLSIRWK
ncbi:MAG: hypothetical protein K2X77_07290 [Candidatus Obscuribacterales bacterium]|nr:hypothetical protein [Candidatus Obscuribacterales bacterium]